MTEKQIAARRLRLQGLADRGAGLTAEWDAKVTAFYDDPAQLVAAICGRRAGKTRGGCRHYIRQALTTPGGRFLYLNSTRGEAERLAWYGNRNDGMAALVGQLGVRAKLDAVDLSIWVPQTDAWIWLRGADKERELEKSLGGAYHEAWWDEAQKIPPKLATRIREVFMPTLLDFGGRLRFTGTASRQMAGLFYDITRPETTRRMPGWSVHHWTLLDNPYFGTTEAQRWQAGIVGTPERMGLQGLYGGAEAAPIESPIMQREAFGRWVREDAAYVYAVHRVPERDLFYAPARVRPDGFADVAQALGDLPFDWRTGMFAMGVDIGWYPDPFAFVLWAWHGHDPNLYEVASFRRNYMTSDEQNDAIKAVREVVTVGMVVADASNPAKPTVKGWSKEWIERYNQPILEAEKAHKHVAIDTYNSDILARRIKFREGGHLYEEMAHLQWSSVVSATGRLIEDPTLANDCCDSSLYAHRHSYQYRWRPEEIRPAPGSPARFAVEEEELEDAAEYH